MIRPAIQFLLGGQVHSLADFAPLDDDEDVAIKHAGGMFHAPASLASLCKLLIAHPESIIVAGSTDGSVTSRPPRSVWLGRVKELHDIRRGNEGLYLGAAVSLPEARLELALLYPRLDELLRATGTLGGCIVDGPPTAEVTTALIAADASLHLRFGDKKRAIPLEDFFIADGQQDREHGELVVGISVPPPPEGSHCRAYKRGMHGAFRITLSAGVVTDARLAYGTLPARAKAAEAELLGKRWNECHVRNAVAALGQDFDDAELAAELLMRFFAETKSGK